MRTLTVSRRIYLTKRRNGLLRSSGHAFDQSRQTTAMEAKESVCVSARQKQGKAFRSTTQPRGGRKRVIRKVN